MKHSLQQGFDLALTNQRLIGGALKRAGVWRSNLNYEDYFQDALVLYATTWVQFEQSAVQFAPYIFQKIVWRTQDQLRQSHRQQHESVEELFYLPAPTTTAFSDWQLVLHQKVRQLTLLERQVLQACLLEVPLAQLASQVHKSSRYLRKIRAQVRQKLTS